MKEEKKALKKCFLLALVLCLLLAACAENGADSLPDSSASLSDISSGSVADSKLPDGSQSSSAQSDSSMSPADLPIEISYVDYDGATEAACTVYQHGAYTFEVPEGWTVVDGTEHGLMNGVFFVPPEGDIDNFRYEAHIALELYDEPPYGEDVPAFELEDTQKDYFAYQVAATYSKMSGLTDLEYFVWTLADGYVYGEQFVRSNDEATMYQTTYHPMSGERDLVVYASHFGQDATPGVDEAAQHLIATFQPA